MPRARLDLFLPRNGVIRIFAQFVIHQLIHVVLLGEACDELLFVLEHASHYVVRNARIKNGVVPVG